MKIRLLVFKYLNKFLFNYFFITMKAEHICYRMSEMCKKVQSKQIWYFVVFVILFLIYLNVYNKIEIIKYI